MEDELIDGHGVLNVSVDSSLILVDEFILMLMLTR